MATCYLLEGFKVYTFVNHWATYNPLYGVSGTYCIVNTASGMIYVGSTGNLSVRIGNHFSELRLNAGRNRLLHEAYVENPEMEVLYKITRTVEEARQLEQECVNQLKDTGKLCNTGIVDVTRAGYGVKREPFTLATRQKMSDAWLTREPDSDATRAKKSLVAKEFYQTDRGREYLETESLKVNINGEEYRSIREASRALHMCRKTIKSKYFPN